MQTPVEIGPSSPSPGQHRRNDATELNLTLARIRNQVPGFSSADALTTMPRVPVAKPEFLSILAFRSPAFSVEFPSCELFSTWLYKLANPCRNWTFQRFARAARKKGRNETNE